MKIFNYLIFVLAMAICPEIRADDFFNVGGVTFHQTVEPGVPGATKPVPQMDSNNQPILDNKGKPVIKQVQIPFIETHITVKEQIRVDATSLKAYFYDENKKLIGTDSTSFVIEGADELVFIPKEKEQITIFVVPDNVLSQENWSAVVVFGDNKGVDAQVYSNGYTVDDYDFPEKNIL
jgi:hypothetical protein